MSLGNKLNPNISTGNIGLIKEAFNNSRAMINKEFPVDSTGDTIVMSAPFDCTVEEMEVMHDDNSNDHVITLKKSPGDTPLFTASISSGEAGIPQEAGKETPSSSTTLAEPVDKDESILVTEGDISSSLASGDQLMVGSPSNTGINWESVMVDSVSGKNITTEEPLKFTHLAGSVVKENLSHLRKGDYLKVNNDTPGGTAGNLTIGVVKNL